MWKELSPGDKVLLNGQKAEVIRLHEVGELPYLRVYVEEEGVKSICAQHVDIEPAPVGSRRGRIFLRIQINLPLTDSICGRRLRVSSLLTGGVNCSAYPTRSFGWSRISLPASTR